MKPVKIAMIPGRLLGSVVSLTTLLTTTLFILRSAGARSSVFGTINGFDVGGSGDLCYLTQLPIEENVLGDTVNREDFLSLGPINEKLVERATDEDDSLLYMPQLLDSCTGLLDFTLEPTEDLSEDLPIFAGEPIEFQVNGQVNYLSLIAELERIADSLNVTLQSPGDEGFELMPQVRGWAQMLFCNARLVGECNPFAFLRDKAELNSTSLDELPRVVPLKTDEIDVVYATEYSERYIATEYVQVSPDFFDSGAALDKQVGVVLPKDAAGTYFMISK